MGLGKTIQSIAFLQHLVSVYKLIGPYLIIAPLSTLNHWKVTIETWTHLNGIIYHDSSGAEGRKVLRNWEWYYTDIMTRGGTSTKSKLIKFHILVSSYETFMIDFEDVLKEIPWQFIIIDEAHRLKNKQAKLLHLLKEIPCKRVLLLTGTPLQNNTEELFTLLNFIEKNKFQSLEQFLQAYGNLETHEQVKNLQAVLRPYLLRRLKEDVEGSIPPLQETIIDVELTNVQKAYYRAIYEKNQKVLFKGSTIHMLNNIEMQLRKCCNHPYLIKGIEEIDIADCVTEEQRFQRMVECAGKLVLLDKLMPKLKAEGKRILIFSQFKQMLSILEEFLIYKSYKLERLDGSVKQSDRQSAIDRFNNKEINRDVFLLSTRAGGLGINLTLASVVIIFDSDWNPQNDIQAIARAHRIGQINEVQVYRLVTAKTYEAHMFERASQKLGLDQAVFSGGVFGGEKKKEKIEENKKEIEDLLKRGAYGLLEDNQEEIKTFMENNIEQILQSKSRVMKYSVIKGAYSLSKSQFVSEKSDKGIDLDDPNF